MSPDTDLPVKDISLAAAQRIVQDAVVPLERTEKLSVDDALGRVLAEDIVARHDVPHYDRAGKDGYAVRGSDTSGTSQQTPRNLRLIDTVYSGHIASRQVTPGTCIEIATGAMMPGGADAVVAVEDTGRSGDTVRIFKAVRPRDNTGARGENIRAGETILERGEWLSYRKIGVLASQGLQQVTVFDRPVIAIMPTGDEVISADEALGPGQLYDVNSYNLSAVVKENGGTTVTLPVSRDTPQQIRHSLEKALESDMVITSGGASVGSKDLIAGMLADLGQILFHGISIKPGRPTMFAMVRNKPVLGMPGYPHACFINAYLLLRPAVRRMARLPPKNDVTVSAVLTDRVAGAIGSRRFQLVRLEGEDACLLPTKPSSVLNIARADGYIMIPEDRAYLEKGSRVEVVLL